MRTTFIFLKSFFYLLFATAWIATTAVPAQALEGHPAGPCMSPHDTPTVGGIVGGDANTQTYTAPAGRTVKRICAATQWSSGKIDHSSHYANYSDECYQISGIGTSTVTVKRVAETYEVPEWQTGPEAGKCSPLTHLDIFLTPQSSPVASPTPASTATPTSAAVNPTPSPSSISITTAGSVKANSDNFDSSTNTPSFEKTFDTESPTQPTTEPKAGKVLGEQTEDNTAVTGAVFKWWWVLVLVVVSICGGLWWFRSKKRQPE